MQWICLWMRTACVTCWPRLSFSNIRNSSINTEKEIIITFSRVENSQLRYFCENQKLLLLLLLLFLKLLLCCSSRRTNNMLPLIWRAANTFCQMHFAVVQIIYCRWLSYLSALIPAGVAADCKLTIMCNVANK